MIWGPTAKKTSNRFSSTQSKMSSRYSESSRFYGYTKNSRYSLNSKATRKSRYSEVTQEVREPSKLMGTLGSLDKYLAVFI